MMKICSPICTLSESPTTQNGQFHPRVRHQLGTNPPCQAQNPPGWGLRTLRVPETWSLRGKVKIDKDVFPHYQVQAMIRPPSLPLMADGSFKEDIPVRNRANGSRDFPSITFDSQAGGYDRPVVHLDDKSKLSTDDLKDQVLVLKDDIVFTKLSPYSSAHAEKEQKLNSGAVGK